MTDPMDRYGKARAAYLRELYQRPTAWQRIAAIFATLWHKCWGGIVLIVATAGLTIGLCAI